MKSRAMLQSLSKPRVQILAVSRACLVRSTRTSTYQAYIQRFFNDGIDVKQQSVEIDPVERIRRCIFYKDVDIWSYYKQMAPNAKTLGDGLGEGCVVSNDGPCIGTVRSVHGVNTLEWLSYSSVLEKSRQIGAFLWKELNLTAMHSKVAILSANRAEYLFVEQGCYMHGLIVVSLYTTYDSKAIVSILRRTEAEVLVVDNYERIQGCIDELINDDQLKRIFVMDEMKFAEKSKIQSLSSIRNPMDGCERPKVDPESIATYILTSGTTGDPKIAMLSHENLLATGKGHLLRLDQANIKKPVTDRHCSFLPMAHVYERFVLLQALLRGTEIVFCPSPDKLIQYLSIVKPTQVSVVPRVLNKVYDTVMSEVNKSPIKQWLVQQALREQPAFLSRLVFRKLKSLFGGEVKAMITGAAPITPEVMHFFRIALGVPIIEGYGQTESAGSGTTTHPVDMSFGTIGSPIAITEIKLTDVPGTDYRSETNQGEVCLRGPAIFKGYYHDESKTREVLDQDGWLYTGDIGEWTSNGALRIVDRTKHIFKLSQGKYIAPERLEDVYIRSLWVGQIFIDALSSEDAVVAIVIPDEDYVRKHFPSASRRTLAELCNDDELKKSIHRDLVRLGEKNNLPRYEIPINVGLHHELFSQVNGLLTVTMKTRRSQARKYFQSTIESLYRTGKTKS